MVAQYDPLQFSSNPWLDWDGSPEHELALDMTYSGGGRCQTDRVIQFLIAARRRRFSRERALDMIYSMRILLDRSRYNLFRKDILEILITN